MKKGQALWKKAARIIPGGNQMLSKRPEMFAPGQWPPYFQKAKGAYVWDLDGTRYADFSLMGIGTCVLGYANESVNRAVKKAVDAGSMSSLNCAEEVELAEKLIALHPWAGQVRFSRTGGEACAMAVRIGRAASGKDKVLFCGYHGWSDWYLSSNLSDGKNLNGQLLPGLEPKGVPRALAGTAYPFLYGNMESFRKRIAQHGKQTGVIIMEVQRSSELDKPFLEEVRRTASKIGAVLVYDEVTSGFRMRAGGLHMLHGIHPDIVVLGKAMGNGYPISAVVGKKNVMQSAQDTFISSTFWTERLGFVAALEVIRQFEKNGVAARLSAIGRELSAGLKEVFADAGVPVKFSGLKAAPSFAFQTKDPLATKTLFTQEMLAKKFLASTLIYASLGHEPALIRKYLAAVRTVAKTIAAAEKKGIASRLLKGPVCHSGFKRLS